MTDTLYIGRDPSISTFDLEIYRLASANWSFQSSQSTPTSSSSAYTYSDGTDTAGPIRGRAFSSVNKGRRTMRRETDMTMLSVDGDGKVSIIGPVLVSSQLIVPVHPDLTAALCQKADQMHYGSSFLTVSSGLADPSVWQLLLDFNTNIFK